MLRALFAFLIFLLYQVLAGGLAFLFGNWAKLTGASGEDMQMPTNRETAVAMLIAAALCIVLLYACRIVRRRPFVNADLRTFSLVSLIFIGLFVIFSAGTSFILNPLELPDGGQMKTFEGMVSDPLCLLLIVVVGPVLEELVFREGIVRALFSKGWNGVAAAVVAALLFAVVHGNLAQGVPAFLLGIVLGLVYVSCRDVRVTILMHIANNALAAAFMRWPDIEKFLTPDNAKTAVFIGIFMVIVAAFFLYAVCRPLVRTRDVADPVRLWANNK